MTVIPFLVVSVGQACNFRCKDCGTMAPYSPKQFQNYACDEIVADIKQIISCSPGITVLQIQGGEPFLYKDLGALLDYVIAQPAIKHIVIATNGSILPADTILERLQNEKVHVRISDYKIQSARAAALQKACGSRGISSSYYTFTSGQSMWYYKGLYEVEREADDAVVSQRFRDCKNCGCLHLERHRLMYCSRAANAAAIQKFDEIDSDYLCIHNGASFPNDLSDYISQKHFMTACGYCYGTDEDKLCTPAVQLESNVYK